MPNFGCIDIDDTRGTDCLEVTANALHLADCAFTAGSANFLYYSSCGGIPQYPIGGPGGTALAADTNVTTIVRCQFSDGNGGSVEAGPWTQAPAVGSAALSFFAKTGRPLGAFAVSHQFGRDGQVMAAPDAARGAWLSLGEPLAPAALGGSARLGETLVVDVRPIPGATHVAALVIGNPSGIAMRR